MYAHFWGEGHSGLSDFLVQVIDVTDANREFEQDNEVRSRERKLAAGVWGEQSTLQVFVWREM